MSDPADRFAIAMPRFLPEPIQDELTVEMFAGDDEPSIIVGIIQAGTSGEYFALGPDEARALAAHLTALADDFDAGRWPEPEASDE